MQIDSFFMSIFAAYICSKTYFFYGTKNLFKRIIITGA